MGFKKHKLEYEPIISDEKDVPVEFANLDNKLTRTTKKLCMDSCKQSKAIFGRVCQ